MAEQETVPLFLEADYETKNYWYKGFSMPDVPIPSPKSQSQLMIFPVAVVLVFVNIVLVPKQAVLLAKLAMG